MNKHRVFISLGSNLKDRYTNIKLAIYYLSSLGKVLKKSSIYETSPVENENQPNFLNCVVELRTILSPFKLLKELKKIEKKLGRVRTNKRYQPRTIDLDILFYDKEIIRTKELTIPHEKLHKRKFVLWPLAEIAPNFIHPLLKKTIKKIKNELRDKTQKIYRIKK
jgi:2-amino-4-hydroxy-6-hydroxymethyldihydropteridine diphosphokinase